MKEVKEFKQGWEKFKLVFKTIKNNIKKLWESIKKAIKKDTFEKETIFFIGIIIIIFTNFLLNFFLGMYFLGLMFIGYSIFQIGKSVV